MKLYVWLGQERDDDLYMLFFYAVANENQKKLIRNIFPKNNNNKNNKTRVDSIGLTLSYEKELSTILYDILLDYVKKQNKLDEFLQYDKGRFRDYFIGRLVKDTALVTRVWRTS